MKTQKFEVLPSQSTIAWVGRKVTGAHDGTIGIKGGSLLFRDNQLSGGRFVIDMQSIKILDVTDPATNAQFASHLASDDFFSIDQHPEAIFEITSVAGEHVRGNLTIKGITNAIGFDADISHTAGSVTASGKIAVDRTRYNIKFRSGNFFKDLGDTLIYNDFDLQVTLTAVPETTTITA
jgi:polyisoprenoid-binding protein YceI